MGISRYIRGRRAAGGPTESQIDPYGNNVGAQVNDNSSKEAPQQYGLAGALGAKTPAAQGPSSQAYSNQVDANQNNANTYGGLSTSYTQNAPTISNQYQDQSRAGIAGNIGSEQGTAAQQGALAQRLMNNSGEASKAQFQHGLDQSIDSQMAMANSSAGGAVGQAGARRAAQEQGAQTQAAGAATAAQLGAQEREASLAQANQALGAQANTYGQVGNQLQGQYGLEQQDAQAQAQLQAQNQAQQNQMRLGYGQLGNQAQGQSENALNDYTSQNLQAQGLTAQNNKNASQATNDLIGGAIGGISSLASTFFADGGTIGARAGGGTVKSTWGSGSDVELEPSPAEHDYVAIAGEPDMNRARGAGQGMMTGMGMAGSYGAPGLGQSSGLGGVYGGLRQSGVRVPNGAESREAKEPLRDPYAGRLPAHQEQSKAGKGISGVFSSLGEGISGRHQQPIVIQAARADGGGVNFLQDYESDNTPDSGGLGSLGKGGMSSMMGGAGKSGMSTASMGGMGAAASGGTIGVPHISALYGPTATNKQGRPATMAEALQGIEHLKARIANPAGRNVRGR